MRRWSQVVGFVVRHRVSFLVASVIYVLVILLLIALSSGPQNEPFLYQVR